VSCGGKLLPPEQQPDGLAHRVDDQAGERDERERREGDERLVPCRTSSAQNAPTTTQAVASGRRVLVPNASPPRNTSPKTTIPTAIAGA
jgi:hypothetical protein